MTTETVKDTLKSTIGEYLDGFVVIGYVAGSNEPVVIPDISDPKTAAAINLQLVNIMSCGGVGVNGK